jgi:hypothetical protein
MIAYKFENIKPNSLEMLETTSVAVFEIFENEE